MASENEETFDVKYFKSQLGKEVSNLTTLSEIWETKSNAHKAQSSVYENNDSIHGQLEQRVEINEEKEGEILAVIGQAKIILGAKGRFKQFEDLIQNCEFGLGEQKTTCTDLQGFWEMILVHVEGIKQGFSKLAALEENGWEEMEISCDDKKIAERERPKLVARKTNTKKFGIQKMTMKSSIPSSGIRQMMSLKRKEMKLNEKNPELTPIITINTPMAASGPIATSIQVTPKKVFDVGVSNIESTPVSARLHSSPVYSAAQLPEKIFDGGFFNISSPPVSARLRSSPAYSSAQLSLSSTSKFQNGNKESESVSAPSSTASTPVRSMTKSLRKSLLVGSAAKKISQQRSESASSHTIRVNSAIRRSLSQSSTPSYEPVLKKLRSRSIFGDTES